MPAAVLAVLLLGADPAPTQISIDDAIAWMHVPAAGTSLMRLEKTGFALLLAQLLPLADRRAVAGKPKARLVATWRRGSGEKIDRTVAVASGPAGDPLVRRYSAADLRGRVDVQRLYGALAHRRDGPVIAGVISRLGLTKLEAFELGARGDAKGVIDVAARLLLPGPDAGIAAALGPPIEPLWPASVPAKAAAFSRFSVRPAALWIVAEKIFSYLSALEYTLVRFQIDAIERRLSTWWVGDALGEAPRIWTSYRLVDASGTVDEILVAEVADAKAARKLVTAVAEVLPGIFPRVRVEHKTARGLPIVQIGVGRHRGMAIGFTTKQLVLSRRLAAVEAHLSRKGRAKKLGGSAGKAVAHGMVTGRAVANQLGSHVTAVDSVWSVRRAAYGFDFAVEPRH